MIKLIKTFPEQLAEAIELAHQIDTSKFDMSKIQQIAISGMGGSGIGVHLVKAIVEEHCELPILLLQGYKIPKWVNKNTLFIACSYSGNTEETLSLIKQARSLTQNLFAITTGGGLKEIADQEQIPQYNFNGDAKCPRAGLAFPSTALLMLLNKLGVCQGLDIESYLKNTVKHLESNQNRIIEEAKDIAEKLKGSFSFVYSDQRFYAAALRFQQQQAENSKQLSHANVFPELNHNEIVGWDFPENASKKYKIILLKTDYDFERNRKRMEISKEIFHGRAEVIEVNATGDSVTAQLYFLVHMIDWITYYLAEQNQIDPFPVENIDYLKNKLSS